MFVATYSAQYIIRRSEEITSKRSVWLLEQLLTTIATLTLSQCTVYPKKYAHGFVVLCFVVVMQSFIMNSHDVFIHIHQGCFAGTGAIVRLPQYQWSKPDGYGKISQRITTTKHSKAKTVCIFLGIYCTLVQFTLECHWNATVWHSVHWDTTVRPSKYCTGTQNCPTLECHWRNWVLQPTLEHGTLLGGL